MGSEGRPGYPRGGIGPNLPAWNEQNQKTGDITPTHTRSRLTQHDAPVPTPTHDADNNAASAAGTTRPPDTSDAHTPQGTTPRQSRTAPREAKG